MNVPNALSLFRICLVPIYIWVFFFSGLDDNTRYYIAAVIYGFAALTDVLDGIIARKYNLITRLGKVLDPLADKLMTTTVFISIAIVGIIPWWVIGILLLKEVLMIVGGAKLYREKTPFFSANKLGKATTVLLVAGGIAMLLFKNMPDIIKYLILLACLILAIIAFFTYLNKYINFIKRKKTNE